LTTDPAVDSDPAWSPDGKSICLLRRLSPNKSAIMIVPQAGGQERKLGESGNSHLAWTPDSKWLAFSESKTTEGGQGLLLLSVDSVETRRLTSPPARTMNDVDPEVSPDGHILAFTRHSGFRSEICRLPLAEGYVPKGEPEKAAETGEQYNSAAVWMPNGT
jgi:Tol biopolymer transport system component